MDPELGASFAKAIAAKDAAALIGMLSADVDFRAMTPNRFWESSSPEEIVNDVILGTWFKDTDHIDDVEATEGDAVGDRRRVGYRLRVTNDGGTFAVEQQAYYGATNDRIDWLRIMCSGYRPIGATG